METGGRATAAVELVGWVVVADDHIACSPKQFGNPVGHWARQVEHWKTAQATQVNLIPVNIPFLGRMRIRAYGQPPPVVGTGL